MSDFQSITNKSFFTFPDPLKFSQELSVSGGAACKNRPVACVFPFTYKVCTIIVVTSHPDS